MDFVEALYWMQAPPLVCSIAALSGNRMAKAAVITRISPGDRERVAKLLWPALLERGPEEPVK